MKFGKHSEPPKAEEPTTSQGPEENRKAAPIEGSKAAIDDRSSIVAFLRRRGAQLRASPHPSVRDLAGTALDLADAVEQRKDLEQAASQ